MARFIAIFLIASLLVGLAIYGLAASQGLDLLDSQVRTIGGLAVVTALYAGLRIAMVARKLLAPRENEEAGEDAGTARATTKPKKKSSFSRWGRSSSLDARLAARQARLDAAKARQEAGDPDTGETS